MAWMLQPKSFYQAMRPNFYTVAYRRSGAYKGMGGLGQEPPSTETLLNLPLVGPYTSAAYTPPAFTTIPQTSTQVTPTANYWIWIAGALLVMLAMKR